MKTRLLIAAVALTSVAFGHAAAPVAKDEHAAHHPVGAVPSPAVSAAKVDQQMKMMQDMREKMLTAKTPEERAALMKDHMKAMQDGMAMMGQMRGGMPMRGNASGSMGDMGKAKGMPNEPDMMRRRMDMMEMMMQMMMDRQAMQSPTK